MPSEIRFVDSGLLPACSQLTSPQETFYDTDQTRFFLCIHKTYQVRLIFLAFFNTPPWVEGRLTSVTLQKAIYAHGKPFENPKATKP